MAWVVRAVVVLSLICSGFARANTLDGIRMHDDAQNTRVVITTSAAPRYEAFTMSDPPRVVIDLADTSPSAVYRPPRVDGVLVRGIRTAKRKGNKYRVVLDLRRAARHEDFVLEPMASYGHRLVIDLKPTTQTRDADQGTAARPSPFVGRRNIVVAIDAGHGGEDPGSIGNGNIYEKNVVLAISRQVKSLLNQMRGFRGELVRTDDTFIHLRKRTEIAADMRPDLFVSIHADSFRESSVRGASVYALSNRGASSEEARLLAQRENEADLVGGTGSIALGNYSQDVRETLVDIAMNANMERSPKVGQYLLDAMARSIKTRKNTVGHAAFMVLKLPGVPSVLVETGYLSNPGEARLLATKGHRQKVARAIVQGIHDYFLAQPPPDSLLAEQVEGEHIRHTIKRGDTISTIAERYGVRSSDIRVLNGVVGDRIHAGDVLLIPLRGGGS